MRYSTIQEIDTLLKNGGIGSSKMQAMLVGVANDISKRVDWNFRRLGISPDKPSGNFTGQLKRSIHWAIFNATGGNEAIMRFYTQNIQSFVELAVQGGHGLDKGGMPSMIPKGAGGGFGPVAVDRGWTHRRRDAKPFLSHEMRLHGNRLFKRLLNQYGYMGNLIILKAALPNGMTGKDDVIRMTTNGWESNINTFRFDGELY